MRSVAVILLVAALSAPGSRGAAALEDVAPREPAPLADLRRMMGPVVFDVVRPILGPLHAGSGLFFDFIDSDPVRPPVGTGLRWIAGIFSMSLFREFLGDTPVALFAEEPFSNPLHVATFRTFLFVGSAYMLELMGRLMLDEGGWGDRDLELLKLMRPFSMGPALSAARDSLSLLYWMAFTDPSMAKLRGLPMIGDRDLLLARIGLGLACSTVVRVFRPEHERSFKLAMITTLKHTARAMYLMLMSASVLFGAQWISTLYTGNLALANVGELGWLVTATIVARIATMNMPYIVERE